MALITAPYKHRDEIKTNSIVGIVSMVVRKISQRLHDSRKNEFEE